jgi:hypothetical protein
MREWLKLIREFLVSSMERAPKPFYFLFVRFESELRKYVNACSNGKSRIGRSEQKEEHFLVRFMMDRRLFCDTFPRVSLSSVLRGLRFGERAGWRKNGRSGKRPRIPPLSEMPPSAGTYNYCAASNR